MEKDVTVFFKLDVNFKLIFCYIIVHISMRRVAIDETIKQSCFLTNSMGFRPHVNVAPSTELIAYDNYKLFLRIKIHSQS